MNLHVFVSLGVRLLPSWPSFSGPILLYLGPETIMPLASILAALVGVLLLAWRYVLGFFRKIFGRGAGKGKDGSLSDPATDSPSAGENDA